MNQRALEQREAAAREAQSAAISNPPVVPSISTPPPLPIDPNATSPGGKRADPRHPGFARDVRQRAEPGRGSPWGVAERTRWGGAGARW